MDMAADRGEMLKKVQAAEFAAYDLMLYLDTHPNSQAALTKFKEAVEKGKQYRKEFEAVYGPLTARDSSSAAPWQWIQDPWPWNRK